MRKCSAEHIASAITSLDDSRCPSLYAGSGGLTLDEEDRMSRLEVIPRMRVQAGRLDGFKRQVAECVRLTKESGAPVRRYDWFLSKDGAECELRELYPDAQAFVA